MKEPPINLSSGRRYDSVVNKFDDPTVFVIFSSSYAYPRYLITFKYDYTKLLLDVHDFGLPHVLQHARNRYSRSTITHNAVATAEPHVLPTSVTNGTVNDVPTDKIIPEDAEMTCEDDIPPSPLSESESEEDNTEA